MKPLKQEIEELKKECTSRDEIVATKLVEDKVKKHLLDFELFMNCHEEAGTYFFYDWWVLCVKGVKSFDKEKKIFWDVAYINDANIKYFKVTYNLNIYSDDWETAYKKIFGDFEND